MVSKFVYIPQGVCSSKMEFEIDEDRIRDVQVSGGCNGNLKGIRSLLRGMRVREAIERLHGITCGNKPTSCPDQIAKALLEWEEKQTWR